MSVKEKTYTKEEFHKQMAVSLFNSTWDYLEKENRTKDEDETMIHMAHASRYHWEQIGKPINLARGDWQVSRVYAVIGRSEPALHHADRCLDVCLKENIKDFDLAFAYEAMSRAFKVANNSERMKQYKEKALLACEDIEKKEDKNMVIADLETI